MEPYPASHFDHDCCRPFLYPGSNKGILLLHGFTGSVSHMRPLGDALADLGYTVMGVNLPGHATTEADMARANAAQWIAAAHEALQTLRKRCDTVTVAGLSMGGLLALLLAEEGLADACVAISAPMATRNRWLRYAWLVAPFYPRVSWAPEADRHRDLNPAFDYGYSGFPTRNALDLAKLIHKARKGLSRVRCPLLVVQSTGDKVVWPGSADWIAGHVGTKTPQRLTLQNVPHACTISAEMPRIAAAMDDLEKSL